MEISLLVAPMLAVHLHNNLQKVGPRRPLCRTVTKQHPFLLSLPSLVSLVAMVCPGEDKLLVVGQRAELFSLIARQFWNNL